MYNLQIIEERIMSLAEKKKLSKNKLLLNVHLHKSVFDNMKKGQIPSVDKLHIIAEYLECSVDYLLGRTDFPEVNRGHIRLDSKNDTEFGEVFEFNEGYMFLKKGAQLTPALKAEFEQMKNVKEGK